MVAFSVNARVLLEIAKTATNAFLFALCPHFGRRLQMALAIRQNHLRPACMAGLRTAQYW